MSLRALLVAAASAMLCCARLVAQPCTPQFFGGFPALDGAVRCMAVYDDGTGPALFIGGAFTTAASGSDLPVSRIAKWTGSAWQAVSGGVNGTVYCMQVWDDGLGGGPGLYVGGVFDRAGGESVKSIARLDATGWHNVGGGVEYGDYAGHYPYRAEVRCMTLYDEGAGSNLFVGGDFDLAQGVRLWSVARWNGSSWSAVGPERPGSPGIGFVPNYFRPVNVLTVYPDPQSGPLLIAGGSFTLLPLNASLATPGIARWNGIAWQPIWPTAAGPSFTFSQSSGEFGGIYCATTSLDNGQITLFFGGRGRSNAGGIESPRVWQFRPSLGGPQDLIAFSDVVQYPRTDAVFTMTPHDDGAGLRLLIGGEFASNYGNRLIAYTGNNNFTQVGLNGVGANGPVQTLSALQSAVSPGLYVGGGFTSIGGVSATRLARFGCAGASSPTAFPLLSPPHNALAQPQSPMFQWAPPGSASPVYYALRVYLDVAQTQLAYAQNNIVGASFTPPPMTFAPGTRYYWSVAASNINGSTPCAAPFSFATRSIGDCDGNGLVNFIDLNAVLSVFGQAP